VVAKSESDGMRSLHRSMRFDVVTLGGKKCEVLCMMMARQILRGCEQTAKVSFQIL